MRQLNHCHSNCCLITSVPLQSRRLSNTFYNFVISFTKLSLKACCMVWHFRLFVADLKHASKGSQLEPRKGRLVVYILTFKKLFIRMRKVYTTTPAIPVKSWTCHDRTLHIYDYEAKLITQLSGISRLSIHFEICINVHGNIHHGLISVYHIRFSQQVAPLYIYQYGYSYSITITQLMWHHFIASRQARKINQYHRLPGIEFCSAEQVNSIHDSHVIDYSRLRSNSSISRCLCFHLNLQERTRSQYSRYDIRISYNHFTTSRSLIHLCIVYQYASYRNHQSYSSQST